jgi:hypothetical protein
VKEDRVKRQRHSGTDVLNPAITRAARQVSKTLADRGFAHALIGGLAVNRHGYPRTTGDVDFLVTREAAVDLLGDSLGGEAYGKTIRVGGRDPVVVDLLFPRPEEDFLEGAIRDAAGTPPVIPKAPLVYLKLACGRMKDQADVVELLKRGKLDIASVKAYLKKHRPDIVDDFSSMVELAQIEND